jgi:hypothetical protein
VKLQKWNVNRSISEICCICWNLAAKCHFTWYFVVSKLLNFSAV